MSLRLKTISGSLFTTFHRASPVKETPSKAKEIQTLFSTKCPKAVLETLKDKGYSSIDECHCCRQFSRDKDSPKGNPDAREIAETALVNAIDKQHPNKEKPLTICSLASGKGFEDLVLLSKLHAKGYKNISWILVDPIYSGKNGRDTQEQGQKLLAQFKELADDLCPGIKIQTIDFLEELYTTKLIDTPDAIWGFDDDMFESGWTKFSHLFTELTEWIGSRSKPVLYLFSNKWLSEKLLYNTKTHHSTHGVHVEVFLSEFNPRYEEPTMTSVSNSIMPPL